jgi:hypothetical protein
LKSNTFWRTNYLKNSARSPTEINVLSIENERSPLQQLPTELFENIDGRLLFRDKVALRLTSRTLFIRLPAPVAKDKVGISDLDDLEWDWKLHVLARREERGLLTFLSAGETNAVQVPMLVCSFAAAVAINITSPPS